MSQIKKSDMASLSTIKNNSFVNQAHNQQDFHNNSPNRFD
jgi:hypothetical protein